MPKGVLVTNFWSPLDGIIVPGRNSVLEHPGVVNVRTMSHHWGYLLSQRIYGKVRDALLDKLQP